ncbi:MAG: hypothetical protein ACR2Q4_04555 [Geminicoccaceae bacterium]
MRKAKDSAQAASPVQSDFRQAAPVGDRASIPSPSGAWTAVDWEDLVPRLLLLAMSRLARMTWRGRWNAVTPGTVEAEDFVNEAIAKTIAGVRFWSPETCTLFQHLAGVVVSDISHAATAAENRLTLAGDGNSERDGGWPPDRIDEAPGQEQTTVWRSEQRRLLDHLHAIDPVMGNMATLMLVEDIDESSQLARRLDRSVADIANLRKRMKRAVRAYLEPNHDQDQRRQDHHQHRQDHDQHGATRS